MDVRYEKKDELVFIGFHTAIRPDKGYEECPKFWDESFNGKYARLWATMKPENAEERAILENSIGMFAICHDQADHFEYWIAGLYRGGEVPEGFELFTCPTGEWAIFSTKGPLPGSLQSLNDRIFSEWYPAKGNTLDKKKDTMIEVYSAGNMNSPDYECGIWIPISRT